MIGVYDYTILFTFLGTLCGVGSIYFSLNGNAFLGVLFLLVAGFFDSMDGFVARTKKNRSEFEKDFGVQLDSLSDVICFGVAPMFLALQIAEENLFLQLLSILCLFTAISRLAWFNVDEMRRRKKESGQRTFYTGLPVTPTSIIYASVYLMRSFLGMVFPYVYFGVLLLVSYLQLSKIEVPHLKGRGQMICVIYGITILVLLIICNM